MTDYAVSYGGLTMGPGTQFKINKLSGLRSLPTLRVSDYAKLKRHGTYSGIDVLEGRTVDMDLSVIGLSASDLETQMALLEAATVPLLTGSSPFDFSYPTVSTRVLNARVRKRVFDIIPSYNKHWIQGTVEWFCPDPRIYSTTTGGHSYTSGSTASITNAGNFEARPLIVVSGITTPVTIVNNTEGGIVKLAGWMFGAIPDPCTIDLLNQTITDASGNNRMDVLDPSTTWFPILPGVNSLSISNAAMEVMNPIDAWS